MRCEVKKLKEFGRGRLQQKERERRSNIRKRRNVRDVRTYAYTCMAVEMRALFSSWARGGAVWRSGCQHRNAAGFLCCDCDWARVNCFFFFFSGAC